MTTNDDAPIIERAVFGPSESDVPAMGIDGAATWPVIESGRTGLGAGALRATRRHVTWFRMLRHCTAARRLDVVAPPTWALGVIARRRAKAGLEPATEAAALA